MPGQLIFSGLLIVQGAIMFADEFYFHRKRNLPRWERIGHPLDTFSVLVVFLAFSVLPKMETTPYWLIGLMTFSCLFITKDEWVHQQECSAGEHWLHSVLFVLHPTLFFSAWWIWKESGPTAIQHFALGALTLFLGYQIAYWNFIRADRKENA